MQVQPPLAAPTIKEPDPLPSSQYSPHLTSSQEEVKRILQPPVSHSQFRTLLAVSHGIVSSQSQENAEVFSLLYPGLSRSENITKYERPLENRAVGYSTASRRASEWSHSRGLKSWAVSPTSSSRSPSGP